MKKLIFYFLFFCLIILNCNTKKIIYKEIEEYQIVKIDIINDWYIIYAVRNDNKYKIVSSKNNSLTFCNKISEGNSYILKLASRSENAPTINGVKLTPINPCSVQCYSFDSKTDICIEPENGIYDLYFCENLKGLCIIENISNKKIE